MWSRKQCVGSSARVDALCSSCSLMKYLERWPAALYKAGQPVLLLMKGSKILRIELNTVCLYQHYLLFMPNKLQYIWHGVYCNCVWPAQLPVLTEVRAASILEQHPRYVHHRDRTGYNIRVQEEGQKRKQRKGGKGRKEKNWYILKERDGYIVLDATIKSKHANKMIIYEPWGWDPLSRNIGKRLPLPAA